MKLETYKSKFYANCRESGDCLEWTGGLIHGYGRATFQNRKWRAHRLSWFLTFGVEPTQYILHSCDNRRCVNPQHLREGTHKENMKDMVVRGRQAVGDCHGNAKLTQNFVLAIRESLQSGITPEDLADKYQVSVAAIKDIQANRTWRHLP